MKDASRCPRRNQWRRVRGTDVCGSENGTLQLHTKREVGCVGVSIEELAIDGVGESWGVGVVVA